MRPGRPFAATLNRMTVAGAMGMAGFGLPLGLVSLLALAFAPATGCAKDPTELFLTATLDGTPARPITSLKVTLDAAGLKTSRDFAALGAVAADADVAPFMFPAALDYLISIDAIRGVVDVTIEGSDPLTDATLLAKGSGQALVQAHKTTTATIALELVAPPDNDGGTGGDDGGAGPDASVDDAAPADGGP